MKRVMIDIETLGTDKDSAILSIGACSNAGDEFEMYPKIIGKINPSTVLWWFGQCEDGRLAQVKAERVRLTDCLKELKLWCLDINPDEYWANGVTFDFNILDNWYFRSHMTPPWRHSQIRDYRTVSRMFGLPALNNNHTALGDALNQMQRLEEYNDPRIPCD